MTDPGQKMIEKAYKAFNERNVEAVLSLMHPQVHWPNGWEGGYLRGHDEVKEYWGRQWNELDPSVIPLSIKEKEDGRFETEVHQVVKDLHGKLLSDSIIKHIYTIEKNLITKMEIEK